MRLTTLELDTFRRFKTGNLDLSEPLIALTGPNEAGKSSLLRAMRLLDDGVPVEPARDITRNSTVPDNHCLVRGLFRLDNEDKKAIANFHGGDQIQHYVVERWKDGTFATGLRPNPTRSTLPINAAIETLVRAQQKLSNRKRKVLPDAFMSRLAAVIDATKNFQMRAWDIADEDRELDGLSQQLSEAMGDIDADDAAAELISGCTSALVVADAARNETHPQQSIRQALYGRRPSVIPFLERERDLRATYDLQSSVDDTPDALANLAALANLSLTSLLEARNNNDVGRVFGLLNAANSQLARSLTNWSQSSLTLQLVLDGSTLRLLITTPNEDWLSEITERSDGLRSYIALVAAIAWARRDTESKRPTLLLLDEAEQHLHYDAQADLVDVLTTGRLANQVVYTTHSAGCLPEDLGASVRVVLPDIDSERSRIQNWFWQQGPGFSPLIFGMGASSLAFSSARRAVLTEGASDTIALPSLLREALGIARLGYQIAPGLAEVGVGAAMELDLEAARVVYLVDGDAAGRGIRDKLKNANVKDTDMLSLGGARNSGATLEDLVSPTAFKQAYANSLNYGGNVPVDFKVPTPQTGRAAAAKVACEAASLTPPSKRVLAQEIVVLARESSILSERGARILRQLHNDISSRLGLAPTT